MRILEKLRNIELEVIKSGLTKEAYRECYRFYIVEPENYELEIYQLIMWEDFALVLSSPRSKEAIFGQKEEIFQYLLEEVKNWPQSPNLDKEKILEGVGFFLGITYETIQCLSFRTQREKYQWVKKYVARGSADHYLFPYREQFELAIYKLKTGRMAFLMDCSYKTEIVFGGVEEMWSSIWRETKNWKEELDTVKIKLLAEGAAFLGFSIPQLLEMDQLKKREKFSIMEYYVSRNVFPLSNRRLLEAVGLPEDFPSYQIWTSLWKMVEDGKLTLEKLYSFMVVASI